jgi:predicted GNAT family acetyltransferase
MKVNSHASAESFLSDTRVHLEADEIANGLMLGICDRILKGTEYTQETPCLKTVNDDGLVMAAVMTPPHNLIVYSHQGDLYRGAGVLIESLVGEGWIVPGVLGPSEVSQTFAERWTELTGQGHTHEVRLRLLELREMERPVPDQGSLRQAAEADIDLAALWRYEFHREIFGETDQEEMREATVGRIKAGDIYLWEDGRPVSMAMKTRPTRKGISVGLVYTPEELRSRGYATACVGELSRKLLQQGWEFCALFVDVTNVPALRTYEKVGYRPVCDYDEYVFSDEVEVRDETTES